MHRLHFELELLRKPDVILVREGDVRRIGGFEQCQEVISGASARGERRQDPEAVPETLRVIIENLRCGVA